MSALSCLLNRFALSSHFICHHSTMYLLLIIWSLAVFFLLFFLLHILHRQLWVIRILLSTHLPVGFYNCFLPLKRKKTNDAKVWADDDATNRWFLGKIETFSFSLILFLFHSSSVSATKLKKIDSPSGFQSSLSIYSIKSH